MGAADQLPDGRARHPILIPPEDGIMTQCRSGDPILIMTGRRRRQRSARQVGCQDDHALQSEKLTNEIISPIKKKGMKKPAMA